MTLIAQKEAAEIVKTGAKEFRQDSETRLTPGARDILNDAGVKIVFAGSATHSSSCDLRRRAFTATASTCMTPSRPGSIV